MNVRSSLVMASLVLVTVIGISAATLRSLFVPSEPQAGEGAEQAPSLRISLDAERRVLDSPIRFHEVSRESGLEFTYYGSPSPEHYMIEQNGGGCGLFDFDGDGRLDVFLANGSHFASPSPTASHALFRCRGEFRYENVSNPSRLMATGFGMGCAIGDIDNDGFPDVFLAGYGENRFWRNLGDGTFQEIGLGGQSDDGPRENELWGTSAAFADLDGDGNLDLYVANYVHYSSADPPCFTPQNPPVQISCGPLGREARPDSLYRNQGNGRFEDISQTSGIGRHAGKSLGVSVADFDGDDRLDIYVACDTTENLLFHNAGAMQFEEVGLNQGAAVGSEGLARSGMGVACADYDSDGHFDLFVTNFQNEPNDLYQNVGSSGFQVRNTEMGLDVISRPALGFGTVFADFDLDRHPDLFVTNGHVWDLTSLGGSYEFAMKPHLLRNREGERFEHVSDLAGDYFQKSWVGRSAAVGDLDDDGDADLIVTHLLEPAAVLRNDSDRAGRSMTLRLIGTRSARQPLGARVDALIDGMRQTLRCPAGDSYQSAQDSRVIVAVGASDRVDEITVHWPGRDPETWSDVPVVRQLTLIEGGRQVIRN